MRKIVLWALALIIVAPLSLAALFPEDTARLAIDYERSRAALSADTLSIDGEPWYFLAGGPEDGETLLLLHGFGGNKDNWVRLAGNLTDSYRVIIPDLPVDEYEEHYHQMFCTHGIHLIMLVTPQTPEERIRKIARLSGGFIYLVAASSTTAKSSCSQMNAFSI